MSAAFRQLIASLLTLHQKPAVVAVGTLVWPGYLSDPTPKCGNHTDIATYPHWDLEKELRIPVVDYAMATCPSGNLHG